MLTIEYNTYQQYGSSKVITKENDYAVAYGLNNSVLGIIAMIVMADNVGKPEDSDIHELNRAYVLVTDELEKLYDSNPKLAAIKPEPIWKRFDVIKTSSWEINEYLEDPENDLGQAHNARVEKLMILAGKDTPEFTPEQKKLLDYADSVRIKYGNLIDVLNKERIAKKLTDWQIPDYILTYDDVRGTIKINDVYQLNKRSTNDDSNIDKILAKGMQHPNELFDPALNTSKTVSSIIGNAGFTPTLRRLFFPVARKGKGVLLRPTVTHAVADAEGIDTTELDLKLKVLGAVTEPKSHE